MSESKFEQVENPAEESGFEEVTSTSEQVTAVLDQQPQTVAPEASEEEKQLIYSSFLPFIQLIQGDEGLDATVNKFSQLYFHDKDYEAIFEIYERSYMDNLPEGQKDKAYEFFLKTFSDLTTDDGVFKAYPFPK